MTCPFCDADRPELISLFGSQLLLSQYRCRACGTYFEGLREDREQEVPDGPDENVCISSEEPLSEPS